MLCFFPFALPFAFAIACLYASIPKAPALTSASGSLPQASGQPARDHTTSSFTEGQLRWVSRVCVCVCVAWSRPDILEVSSILTLLLCVIIVLIATKFDIFSKRFLIFISTAGTFFSISRFSSLLKIVSALL